ncbi:MAG: FAD-dependent oxidoreductase [Leptospiraceae bacterium]|nr:FAD-dependent oxidoreductase [Leptospiraceae bacterium]
MNKAVPVLRDLCLKAQELYEELDKKKDFEFNFKKEGLFVLYNTEHGEDDEVRVAEIGNKIGIKAEVKNADEIMAMEPNLKLSARGGVFYPDDAHITPHLFSESMVNYLKKNGVTILDNTEVTSIESNGRGVRRIKTSAGDFKAKEYVVTGGSWSVPLLRTAGINLLMQAGKGYSISMKNPDAQLKYPYILNEARVAITPMKGFLRFAGTMEMAGIDLSINQRRVNAIARNVPKYFANFNVADTTNNEIWGGLRPCTPDGMPYIGRFKEYHNLSIVAGHAMVGITLATVSGQLMAQVLGSQKTEIDMELLKPDRFN